MTRRGDAFAAHELLQPFLLPGLAFGVEAALADLVRERLHHRVVAAFHAHREAHDAKRAGELARARVARAALEPQRFEVLVGIAENTRWIHFPGDAALIGRFADVLVDGIESINALRAGAPLWVESDAETQVGLGLPSGRIPLWHEAR